MLLVAILSQQGTKGQLVEYMKRTTCLLSLLIKLNWGVGMELLIINSQLPIQLPKRDILPISQSRAIL